MMNMSLMMYMIILHSILPHVSATNLAAASAEQKKNSLSFFLFSLHSGFSSYTMLREGQRLLTIRGDCGPLPASVRQVRE
jgi:hypothetical protein